MVVSSGDLENLCQMFLVRGRAQLPFDAVLGPRLDFAPQERDVLQPLFEFVDGDRFVGTERSRELVAGDVQFQLPRLRDREARVLKLPRNQRERALRGQRLPDGTLVQDRVEGGGRQFQNLADAVSGESQIPQLVDGRDDVVRDIRRVADPDRIAPRKDEPTRMPHSALPSLLAVLLALQAPSPQPRSPSPIFEAHRLPARWAPSRFTTRALERPLPRSPVPTTFLLMSPNSDYCAYPGLFGFSDFLPTLGAENSPRCRNGSHASPCVGPSAAMSVMGPPVGWNRLRACVPRPYADPS